MGPACQFRLALPEVDREPGLVGAAEIAAEPRISVRLPVGLVDRLWPVYVRSHFSGTS